MAEDRCITGLRTDGKGLFINKNVPEPEQKEAPEFRIAVQGMYRLLKEGKCKLNLRAGLKIGALYMKMDILKL